MPQTERPDEIEAKALIEAELAVSLRHADTNGGVDYLFELPDGTTAAAEITTVTNGSLKRSNDAWMGLRRRQQPTSVLSRCWTVIVHEDRATYNRLLEALVPALAALESASIDRFREHEMADVMSPPGSAAREAGRALRSRAVVEARTVPRSAGCEHEAHYVHVAPMGGSVAQGSDQALALIESDLQGRPDNAKKLSDAQVAADHLFVWLDSDTPGEMSRPFRGGMAEEWSHFGLPERAPVIDGHISDLWVVHRGTGVGWHWNCRSGWWWVGR